MSRSSTAVAAGCEIGAGALMFHGVAQTTQTDEGGKPEDPHANALGFARRVFEHNRGRRELGRPQPPIPTHGRSTLTVDGLEGRQAAARLWAPASSERSAGPRPVAIVSRARSQSSLIAVLPTHGIAVRRFPNSVLDDDRVISRRASALGLTWSSLRPQSPMRVAAPSGVPALAHEVSAAGGVEAMAVERWRLAVVGADVDQEVHDVARVAAL